MSNCPPRGICFDDSLLDITPLGCLIDNIQKRSVLDDFLLEDASHGCLTVLRRASVLMTPYWTYPPRSMLFLDTLLDIAHLRCLIVRDTYLVND